ncbi:MAG: division/cell wall cluster transcriptional repressor MraZ [Eggerthellaceae bacterium]
MPEIGRIVGGLYCGVGESGIECRSSVQGWRIQKEMCVSGLFGEYRHKIDAKGRLSLPAALRKGLTEDTQLVVVPNVKTGFLSVYTVEAFEAWQDALFEKKGGYNPGDRMHVMLRTSSMPAQCKDATPLSITLVAKQREMASLEKTRLWATPTILVRMPCVRMVQSSIVSMNCYSRGSLNVGVTKYRHIPVYPSSNNRTSKRTIRSWMQRLAAQDILPK